MKYLLLSFSLILFSNSYSQAPYISDNGGDGLGEYGYLERDAVTFATLNRNTYTNIDFLTARFYVTAGVGGVQYLYHTYDGPDGNWACNNGFAAKKTLDYSASHFGAEWKAGSNVYVSVFAKYCPVSTGPWDPFDPNTNAGAGFNERHYQVINIDSTVHSSTAFYLPDANGSCNQFTVAGSFVADPGNLTGISLTSLKVNNAAGTALETTDIPASGFSVYYELVTGSETFNGSETSAGNLSGSWDGNSTDNIYANTSLAIPVNGKTRIYILLCDYNGPAALNRTVRLHISNDGIDLSPSLDNHKRLRVNDMDISQRLVVLPVNFTSLNGKIETGRAFINWKVENSTGVEKFVIENSADGRTFQSVGSRLSNQSSQNNEFQFVHAYNPTFSFYRIKVLYINDAVSYSNVIRMDQASKDAITLIENPAGKNITVNYSGVPGKFFINLVNTAGQIVSESSVILTHGKNEIFGPGKFSAGVYLLRLTDANGKSQVLTLMIK